MTSHQKTEINRTNLRLEHVAQSRLVTGQQEVVSLRRFQTLFDGSTFWFKYEELIDDWLDPAVLESRKARTSTEEQTCRRCRNMHKGLLDRESLSAENGVKYFRDTLRLHFIKGAQSVFFSGDSISSFEQEEEVSR